jgi:peptide/nickel transport system substrate-binding protein
MQQYAELFLQAIDRQYMIDTIFFGYGKPATSALSSNFSATGLHAEMPNYPATGDVAAANKILDDAGYARDGDGVRMKGMFDLIPYGEDWKRGGQYIQQGSWGNWDQGRTAL